MSSLDPNYAPDTRVTPTRVLDAAEFGEPPRYPSSRQFTLSSLRFRVALNFVAVSLAVLVLMGSIIAVTGLWQVHHAQDQQSQQAVTSVRRFAESTQRRLDEKTTVSTYDVLYGYLGRAPREAHTSLIGVVEGTLRAYQAGRGDQAVGNRQLMERICAETQKTDRAQAISIDIDDQTWRATIVPLFVGNERGALVLVQDVDAAIEPTLNLVRIFAGVSLVVLTLVAFVTWMGMSRILRPLAQLRAMTRSVVTADDLTQRLPVAADDDLGDVAASFNDMIDRLQHTFESQRHLLNDAGHELRTPLTVVSGHLELMDPTDPVDAAHTRDLVLEEVARMHRMTEDLIDVARATTPNFVRPEDTNITELTLDVVQHASQLGEQRFTLDNLGEGQVWADQQRLSQAMLQLAENATKFSEPHSRIFIGSGIDVEPELIGHTGRIIPTTPVVAPGHVRPRAPYVALWVRDEGIGIEPRNALRIFDRFARVDHARPGSGLGLTIVSAIAAAHHGSLELRSAPGSGSVFTLFIPLKPGKGGTGHG